MSDIKTNQFGGALLFILGEFAVAEDEMIEDGGMEVFGEDDQGREGSCEVSINELAQAASDEIKHLTEQLAKANERVKELEEELAISNGFIAKKMPAVFALSGKSKVAKLTYDEAMRVLNKFAIEQQIKALEWFNENNLLEDEATTLLLERIEQLRKEQD